MKNETRFFALSLTVLFFVSFTISRTTAPYETSVFAQQKRTTTKVADNKYGEGGTLETTSDEKLRLEREQWRDKDGKIREYHRFFLPAGEDWLFVSTKNSIDYMIELTPHGGGTWDLTQQVPKAEKGPILTNVSREEIDKAIAEIEKQFAKDGTIPKTGKEAAKPEEKPKQETGFDPSLKQPTLPSEEVFTPKADPCTEGAPAVTPEKVPAAQATARIKCHITHIEERRKQMIDAYFDTAAKKTLEAAFKAKGVTSSMTYAEAWGEGGIGLTWSESAKQFYAYHLDSLSQSIKTVEARGFATRDEMVSLTNGMRSWDGFDRNIENQFKQLVESYTEKAKVNDEKVAAEKKFNLDLARASGVTPYNASVVDGLYATHAQTLKPLDSQIRLIEQGQETNRKSIADLAGAHMDSLRFKP